MAKKKQHFRTIITVLVVAAVVTTLIRHYHIRHFKCVVPGVLYTSGQPRRMDYMRLLYKYHLTTFVNVRDQAEHREENWYNEEINWMRENGVNYVELPMIRKDRNYQVPDKATQKTFLEIMSKPENLPVLVHGNSGKKRTSMLAATWLIKTKGYSFDQAMKVIVRIRGKEPKEREIEFLRSLKSDSE